MRNPPSPVHMNVNFDSLYPFFWPMRGAVKEDVWDGERRVFWRRELRRGIRRSVELGEEDLPSLMGGRSTGDQN